MPYDLSARTCKKNAVEVLKTHHLLLPTLLIFSFLFLAFLGTTYVAQMLVDGFLPSDGHRSVNSLLGAYVLAMLFYSFLIAPLWHGIRAVVIHVFLYGRLDFGYFFFFMRDGKRYRFAVRYAVRSLVRFHFCALLLVVLAALGSSVGTHLIATEREAFAMLVLTVDAVFLFLTLVCFSLWRADSFLMDAAILAAPSLTYRQARALSMLRMKEGRRALRRLNTSFLPLWIVSVLLLGVPLIFVVPYHVTSRASLACRLII